MKYKIMQYLLKYFTKRYCPTDKRYFDFYKFQLSETIKKHVNLNLVVDPAVDGVLHKIANDSAEAFLSNWITSQGFLSYATLLSPQKTKRSYTL